VDQAIQERLAQALSRIDRPGSFCASGSVPVVLPGLDVAGVRPIGLPLTAKQAEELIKQCDQAPHGKGAKTIVDTSVRRVWRMGPDRFALSNPDWNRFIGKCGDNPRTLVPACRDTCLAGDAALRDSLRSR
jgi:hypothetical protein